MSSMDASQTAVLRAMRIIYKPNSGCDFKLCLKDGSSLKVHKAILVTFSKFFCKLCQIEMLEDTFDVPVGEYNHVSLVIDFMYTGVLALTSANYSRVLQVALWLEAPSAIQECNNFNSVPTVMAIPKVESSSSMDISMTHIDHSYIEVAPSNTKSGNDAQKNKYNQKKEDIDIDVATGEELLVSERSIGGLCQTSQSSEVHVDDNTEQKEMQHTKTLKRVGLEGIRNQSPARMKQQKKSHELELLKINAKETSTHSVDLGEAFETMPHTSHLRRPKRGAAKLKQPSMLNVAAEVDSVVSTRNTTSIIRRKPKLRKSFTAIKSSRKSKTSTDIATVQQPQFVCMICGISCVHYSTLCLHNRTHKQTSRLMAPPHNVYSVVRTTPTHCKKSGVAGLSAFRTWRLKLESDGVLNQKPVLLLKYGSQKSCTKHASNVGAMISTNLHACKYCGHRFVYKNNCRKHSTKCKEVSLTREYNVDRKTSSKWKCPVRWLPCRQCPARLCYSKAFVSHMMSHGVLQTSAQRQLKQLRKAMASGQNLSRNVSRKSQSHTSTGGEMKSNRDESKANENMWLCHEDCGFSGPTQVSLSRHMISAHPGKTYPCTMCNYSSLLHHRLLRHIDVVHTTPHKYVCNQCEEDFKKAGLLRLHISEAHKPQNIKLKKEKIKKEATNEQRNMWHCQEEGCNFCGLTQVLMTQHMSSSHPGFKYSCSQCHYSTLLHHRLIKHTAMVHSGPTRHMCDQCGRDMKKPGRLRLHMCREHSAEDPKFKKLPCPEAGCVYVAYQKKVLDQHLRSHQKEKPFTCPDCGRKIKSAITLKKHRLKMHLGVRPWVCDACGKCFGEEHELKSHSLTHSERKDFVCQYCDYASSRLSYLKSHMWSLHEVALDDKMKVFVCEECGFKTSRRSRFNDHCSMHRGERPYSCKICDKSFFTRATLRAHKKWLHSEKKHRCTQCGHITATSAHLKEHERIMHTHRNIKPFGCPYCNFCSATNGNCRKHVMRRHIGRKVHYLKLSEEEMKERARGEATLVAATYGVKNNKDEQQVEMQQPAKQQKANRKSTVAVSVHTSGDTPTDKCNVKEFKVFRRPSHKSKLPSNRKTSAGTRTPNTNESNYQSSKSSVIIEPTTTIISSSETNSNHTMQGPLKHVAANLHKVIFLQSGKLPLQIQHPPTSVYVPTTLPTQTATAHSDPLGSVVLVKANPHLDFHVQEQDIEVSEDALTHETTIDVPCSLHQTASEQTLQIHVPSSLHQAALNVHSLQELQDLHESTLDIPCSMHQQAVQQITVDVPCSLHQSI